MCAHSRRKLRLKREGARIWTAVPAPQQIRPKSDSLSWNIIQAADLFGPGATAKAALSDFNAEPLCSLRDSAVLILGGC